MTSKKINTGLLYALLFLWLVALVTPAALLQFGAFGHFDINTSIDGALIGLWIGGYLVSFGIFMGISRIVEPGFPAWFAASILPWAFDWTTPFSPYFWLLWLVVAVGFTLRIATHAWREETMHEHGVHANGVVLQVYQPMMNVIINNAYIKRKLRLRVEGAGAAPYEATYNGLFMFGDVPSAGDRIPLLVDPGDPQRIEYDDSGAAGGDSGSESDDAPRAGGGSMADELAKLGQLHDKGVLTDAQFEAAKEKLLS